MPAYTITVEATFHFTEYAANEAQAIERAKARLAKDPVSNGGFRLGFDDPFIAVAGADQGFPSLEAHHDDCLSDPCDDQERVFE